MEHFVDPCTGSNLAKGTDTGLNNHVLFHEVADNDFRPRTVLVDMDPDVALDWSYLRCIPRANYVNGKEDGASNFARGAYSLGKDLLSDALAAVLHQVERCDQTHTVLLFHSLSGGCGSGLTAELLGELATELGRKTALVTCSLLPSVAGGSPLEPYNATLCWERLQENTELTLMLDNDALYSVCENALQLPLATFRHTNQLVAQVASGLTAPLRMPSQPDMQMRVFLNNLVPFPRIHTVVPHLAPLRPAAAPRAPLSVTDIARMACQPSASLARCDIREGVTFAAALLLRGDVSPVDAVAVSSRIASHVKIATTNEPRAQFPGDVAAAEPISCLNLSNNGAVCAPLQRLVDLFDRLYARRAFMHYLWGEGLSSEEAFYAREALHGLLISYEEVARNVLEDNQQTHSEESWTAGASDAPHSTHWWD